MPTLMIRSFRHMCTQIDQRLAMLFHACVWKADGLHRFVRGMAGLGVTCKARLSKVCWQSHLQCKHLCCVGYIIRRPGQRVVCSRKYKCVCQGRTHCNHSAQDIAAQLCCCLEVAPAVSWVHSYVALMVDLACIPVIDVAGNQYWESFHNSSTSGGVCAS